MKVSDSNVLNKMGTVYRREEERKKWLPEHAYGAL